MKKKFFAIATILAVVGSVSLQTALADGAPTATTTLSGSVTLTPYGKWDTTGLSLSGTPGSSTIMASGLMTDHQTSYLTLVDNNATLAGAKISVKMTSQSGVFNSARYAPSTNIAATATGTGKLKVSNTYIMASPSTGYPTFGANDTTKNVNVITADTCDTYSSSNNSDIVKLTTAFRSANAFGGYAKSLSTSNQRLVTTLNTCSLKVNLTFDKIKVSVPAWTTAGTYKSVLTLTSADGN